MKYEDAQAAVRSGEDAVTVARRFVTDLTPDERLWCLDGDAPALVGLQFLAGEHGYHRIAWPAARVDRVGLGGIRFADGPRGCVVGHSTAFPVPMARGATWDPDLEERVGDVIGLELRAQGANYTGAVCVNVLRHPAWGRAQETYGEDPHHVGEFGAAFTRGLQRHVMACVKHFACNSMENARFTVDIEVDDVPLHEVFLPHFRRVVDEGVASVMTAYNMVNGSWCGESRALVTDILRGEWGFEGFVITDFVLGLRDAANSVAAGVDIEMPFRMRRAHGLRSALDDGTVSWAEVDTAVVRIVSTLLRFDEVLSSPAPSQEAVGAPAHRALAREVAQRSTVLLRNEPVGAVPVLPLDPADSLAVIGRLADRVNTGDAGSSDVWDLECVTVAEGLQAAAGSVVVDDGSDLERAASLAADAVTAVVVVGYTEQDEGEFIGVQPDAIASLFPPQDFADDVEQFAQIIAAAPQVDIPSHRSHSGAIDIAGGDRSSLRLPVHDVELIRAVAAANPRTVVVIEAGSAVVVEDWFDLVPAIVQPFYAGCEAGDGLADVLFGVVDASGRLPFTVARSESDYPSFDREATAFRYGRWHGWWHFERESHEPRYPFGFGLSYTTFELASANATVENDEVIVRVDVANVGIRDGSDVVQVYVDLPDPLSPPRLVGFRRIEVGAGETERVELRIPTSRLARRNPSTRTWDPPSGNHAFRVARSSTDRSLAAIKIEL